MQAVVFDGIKYYKQKSGYYRCAITAKRERENIERSLHRAVWIKYKGNIPKGYHIHHKDENKDNNNIENLELLSVSQHAKFHSKKNKLFWNTEKGVRANRRGIKNAKKWHGTEDGKKWHSEHQIETVRKHLIKEICKECGVEFNTYDDEKRHKEYCKKCRDKLLKRKLYNENRLKYNSKNILTGRNIKLFGGGCGYF